MISFFITTFGHSKRSNAIGFKMVKLYKCKYCYRSFKTSASLASHRYRSHPHGSDVESLTTDCSNDNLSGTETEISVSDEKASYTQSNAGDSSYSDSACSDAGSFTADSSSTIGDTDTTESYDKLCSAILELRERFDDLETMIYEQDDSIKELNRSLKMNSQDGGQLSHVSNTANNNNGIVKTKMFNKLPKFCRL